MTARRKFDERARLGAAVRHAMASESIGRALGDELIAASRDVVTAWHDVNGSQQKMREAIARLEELVGRP